MNAGFRRLTTAALLLAGLVAVSTSAFAPNAFAHGDVTPQAVDTTGLEKLGAEWRESNPYRGNERAIEIGKSAFNQNCARCHGLGAISGGIAPDLRYLEPGDAGDEWFKERVRNGAIRNGITYMPKFDDALGQEALWTIRAWLETVAEQ
jgi:cytochrome c-550 PedF